MDRNGSSPTGGRIIGTDLDGGPRLQASAAIRTPDSRIRPIPVPRELRQILVRTVFAPAFAW